MAEEYKCGICSYQLEAGKRPEDLDEDWTCPVCHAKKEALVKVVAQPEVVGHHREERQVEPAVRLPAPPPAAPAGRPGLLRDGRVQRCHLSSSGQPRAALRREGPRRSGR